MSFSRLPSLPSSPSGGLVVHGHASAKASAPQSQSVTVTQIPTAPATLPAGAAMLAGRFAASRREAAASASSTDAARQAQQYQSLGPSFADVANALLANSSSAQTSSSSDAVDQFWAAQSAAQNEDESMASASGADWSSFVQSFAQTLSQQGGVGTPGMFIDTFA